MVNLSSLAQHFSDEHAAYVLVERIRWPHGPTCPHCGVVGHAYRLAPKGGERRTRTGKVSYRSLWKCGACRKQFSVLVGTIFEGSKIPLSKWLLAVHLMCAGKNGVSAHELHRSLGITYKSAWFMAHRIRYAMERGPLASRIGGVVEIDETYIGGKEAKKAGRPGKDSKKVPVVTLVERTGEARSEAVERVSTKNIRRMLIEHVQPAATIVTDSLPTYRSMGSGYAGHEIINHDKGEYSRTSPVSGLRIHTNTVEGFFSQLNRSIDGTYHHVSARHLHRYLAEFDYRYNARKMPDGDRTAAAIIQSQGKRLMYTDSLAAVR